MMPVDFHFREKIPVGILGATGAVGQKFVQLLSSHPWFCVKALAASERSAGKSYREAVNWLMPAPLSIEMGNMPVLPCVPNLPCSIVFSALDASVAGEIEKSFAEAGYIVISNSRNFRTDPAVPLLIPEINIAHLDLLHYQPFGKGKIVTNPNCSVCGLALSLKPLDDQFGVEEVHVVTMQAISGAGYPGVASLDILDNVIPFISGEEEKVENEPLKIFGVLKDKAIENRTIKISAHCNRVPVSDGHLECVSVKLKGNPSREEIIECWNQFSALPQAWRLPMAPVRPLHYFHDEAYPQAKRHRELDKGMGVAIGRLRKCPLMDFKYVILSHNTIRGAAGGTILIAETMVKKGFVYW